MRAGLAGYSRSGKTTLFNALTGLRRGPEAKLHLGAIKVPDPRLDRLSAIFKPRKTTPAEVTLADLPGPRAKGSALEPEALQALREVDALCVVLNAFEPDADPLRDLRDYEAELILSDLQAAEKRCTASARSATRAPSRRSCPAWSDTWNPARPCARSP